MEQVVRQDLIAALEAAVAETRLVTVSAIAAGGGVSTVLEQWMQDTSRPVEFATCLDFNPQRPLAAFADVSDDVAAAICAGAWDAAADLITSRQIDTEERVYVIDNADRLDEASAHLLAALMDAGCRAVMGHHHAPSTNPSLELLIDAIPGSDRRTMVIPPLTRAEAEVVLGDGVDPGAALTATGGNPLALSMYRGSEFASVAMTVLERFDRLPADGQGLAAVLAASPEPVPRRLLDAMGRPWDSHGRQLERHDLTTVHEDRISLRHDKIRRILYEEMTAMRRRFVHADILGHIGEGDDLTLVMHHAVGAGDVELIVATGPTAAEAATAVGANREAARHLENVLAYEHSIPEAQRSMLRDALDAYLAEAVD